jgi:hypothetical protein
MRERVTDSFGTKSLQVYPHATESTSPARLAACGSVEALTYFTNTGQKTVGVRLNISYQEPMTREKSEQLKAAIDRCWQWIDERGEQTNEVQN